MGSLHVLSNIHLVETTKENELGQILNNLKFTGRAT